MIDLDAIPFVEARWYRSGRLRPIRLLVVHTPEFPELNDGAERLAQFFATTDRPASVHVTVDNDSMVRSVHDGDTAYGAENANADGLHSELVGYAGQGPEEWDDDYSNAVLANGGALFRAWGERHGIPLRRLTVEAIAAGERGICSHADVYAALGGQAYRWDPGPAFPWDEFMAHVNGVATPTKPTGGRMLPSLFVDANGAVWVYDPNTKSKTWVTGPPELSAIQTAWSVAAYNGKPAGDPAIYRNDTTDALLAGAVENRTPKDGGGTIDLSGFTIAGTFDAKVKA